MNEGKKEAKGIAMLFDAGKNECGEQMWLHIEEFPTYTDAQTYVQSHGCITMRPALIKVTTGAGMRYKVVCICEFDKYCHE